MSLGTYPNESQSTLWIPTADIQKSPGHPFYKRLNELLSTAGFDSYVEGLCRPFYAEGGRPSIPPGNYFRMLMVGYFEGISSERGIEWRCSDSLSLREFLGLLLSDRVPDHSSLSRIRHRFPIEIYFEVFEWILQLLAENGLVKGENIGIDATTLEANAAMRSIVRRDTGESYQEFLTALAKASGIETPTKTDLAKLDKTRKNKASNNDWKSPGDPDSGITKMKNGSTHLAHKSEHAIDLDTDAMLVVSRHAGHVGDTTTGPDTLEIAVNRIEKLHGDPAENDKANPPKNIAADKGYHSDRVLQDVESLDVKSYIPGKDTKRNFDGKPQRRISYDSNERRLKTKRGEKLRKLRAEKVERSMAHMYLTGGLRRCWLRGGENVLKRLQVQGVAYNLGLLVRKLTGYGTPRGLADAIKNELLRIFELAMRNIRTIFAARRYQPAIQTSFSRNARNADNCTLAEK